MEITNCDIVDDLKLGETVMFFDLNYESFKINNCCLSRNNKSNCYYWNFPAQKYVSKKGEIIYKSIIETTSTYFKMKVRELATKTYNEIKAYSN